MSSTRHKDAVVWTLVFNEKTVLKNNEKRGYLLETHTVHTAHALCDTALRLVKFCHSLSLELFTCFAFSFAKFTYDKIVNWFLQKYLDFQLFAWRRCI